MTRSLCRFAYQRFVSAIAIAAIAASTLLGPAAQAETGEERVTRLVRYHDLDLSSEADVRRLNRRIEAALRSICGSPLPTELSALLLARKCRERAVITAPAEIAMLIRQVGRG